MQIIAIHQYKWTKNLWVETPSKYINRVHLNKNCDALINLCIAN